MKKMETGTKVTFVLEHTYCKDIDRGGNATYGEWYPAGAYETLEEAKEVGMRLLNARPEALARVLKVRNAIELDGEFNVFGVGVLNLERPRPLPVAKKKIAKKR